MNPELERLMTALRNAHAAGDESAARRFAQLIRERQDSSAATPPDAGIGADGWRDVPPEKTPVAAPAGKFGGSGTFVGEGAGREWGSMRDMGHEAGKSGGAAVAAMRAVAGGEMGLGTPAEAAGVYLRSRISHPDNPMSWNEAMSFARGAREGSNAAHPDISAAGEVAGMALSIEAGGAALSKAPAAVKSVFSLADGQTKRNLARLAVTGAATAGVTAGMQEGADKIVPAAGVGALVGGGVGAATMAAGGLVRAAGARISSDVPYIGKVVDKLGISSEHAAIRVLAKKYKESTSNIAALYNDFVARTGLKPGLAEIASEVEAGRVGQLGAQPQFSEAGSVLRRAQETAANARPGELRAVAESGGPVVTLKEIARARNKAFKHTLSQIGNRRVPLDNSIQDIVMDPEVQGALPPILRRHITDAIDSGGAGLGSVELTVNEFDMMRQAVGGKVKKGAGQLYKDYRNDLRNYVAGHVPEYGAALDKYAKYSEAMKGAAVGQRVTMSDADQFKSAVADVYTPSGLAGVEASARSKLANKAGESAASAEGTAAALTEPGLQERIGIALGVPEAARLGRAGESFTQSARNLRAMVPSMSQAQQEAADAARKVYNVLTSAVWAGGHASGALKAHLGQRIADRISIGPKAVQKLAEYATDPKLAPEAMRRLHAAGVSAGEMLKWYQEAAAIAGITTGNEVK